MSASSRSSATARPGTSPAASSPKPPRSWTCSTPASTCLAPGRDKQTHLTMQHFAQEEIFVPVLSVIPYTDEDQAVEIANSTIYGLSGAVFGEQEHALAIARRLRTGKVDINGAQFNVLAPFGGYKQPGNGREMGRFGLEEFP